MQKLTRMQVSIIFKARTRMMKTKDNFKGKFTDKKCRFCGKQDETQRHILEECAKNMPQTTNLTVMHKEIFSENLIVLKNAARKLDIINKELEKMWEKIPQARARKGKKRKATDQPERRYKKNRKLDTSTQERNKRTTNYTAQPMDEDLREILARMGIHRERHQPHETEQTPDTQQPPLRTAKMKMRRCTVINTLTNKISTRWKIIEN